MLLGTPSTYFLPNDIENVPSDKVGVYSFSLSFPTDYQLGLVGNAIDLEKAIALLKDRLDRYRRALERSHYSGLMESDVFGSHLKKRYALTAQFEQTEFIDIIIDEYFANEGLSEKSFRLLSQVLRLSFLFSTPLYIGMTANQSFRTRLSQHLGLQSNFSLLLKEQGITWSETRFECVPMTGVSAVGINNIEKIVQHLFKPSYCLG